MPTISLPHAELPYTDQGEGPVVVLIHGALVDGRLWRDVVPRLADRHRVVVPDLPLGAHRHPVAPAADLSPPGLAHLIAAFLDALDLEDVRLVGNDSGGGLSQLVAARHPERLGSLVLTNADAYDAFPPRVLQPLCALARRAPRAADALLRGLALRPVRFAFEFPVAKRRDAALSRAWMAPAGRDARIRADLVRVLAGFEPRHHREALPALRRFDRPVTIAWAPGDPLFPFRLAERLAQDLPQAEIVRLARGRAFTPVDQPEALAAAIAGTRVHAAA